MSAGLRQLGPTTNHQTVGQRNHRLVKFCKRDIYQIFGAEKRGHGILVIFRDVSMHLSNVATRKENPTGELAITRWPTRSSSRHACSYQLIANAICLLIAFSAAGRSRQISPTLLSNENRKYGLGLDRCIDKVTASVYLRGSNNPRD